MNTENKEPRFIVAEVSKNWTRGSTVRELLSQRFEEVINRNAERGYELHDWKVTSFVNGDTACETIIAIFETEIGYNGKRR